MRHIHWNKNGDKMLVWTTTKIVPYVRQYRPLLERYESCQRIKHLESTLRLYREESSQLNTSMWQSNSSKGRIWGNKGLVRWVKFVIQSPVLFSPGPSQRENKRNKETRFSIGFDRPPWRCCWPHIMVPIGSVQYLRVLRGVYYGARPN
jgi:hypothetical protein